jgi:hypothetical protein
MATPPRTYARGKSKSGFGASLLTAYGNRLLLTSALKPRGALGKAILIPFVRGLARFFGWWSRGWLGQVLGGKWAIATFKQGFTNHLDPKEVGDAWPEYKEGNVKRKQS